VKIMGLGEDYSIAVGVAFAVCSIAVCVFLLLE
jgi:hypothetical protein